jgi:hypothetical protein
LGSSAKLLYLLSDVPNSSVSGLNFSLGKPKERHTGPRYPFPLACHPVSFFSLKEFSAKTMHIALAIKRCPDRGLRRGLGETFARALGFIESVRPFAMELQNFGAANQTKSAVWDQIWLRRTPRFQCRSPLLGAAKIENFAARFDYAAVNAPGVDGRDLAGLDRDHGFVEQWHSARDISLPN